MPKRCEVMVELFVGNCPKSVAKDAKYSVKRSGGNWAVQLIYRISNVEKALLATDAHPRLVDLVNNVKEEIVGVPGGAFYLNEFKQVIVPADNDYYFAGDYAVSLTFDLDDEVVTSLAPRSLKPGTKWPGPHVGIPYVLGAGARDIRFDRTAGSRVITESLSSQVGVKDAERLARRLAEVKGNSGGRIYVNESREFFAPLMTNTGLDYVYLGPLGDDPWYSKNGFHG